MYLRGVCREEINFYKTVEFSHITLIELMCVDGNDVSTEIHFSFVACPSYRVLNFLMWSVGTCTRAYFNALRNESQTLDTCNVTLAASLCACGRTGEEGLSAHQVRMK